MLNIKLLTDGIQAAIKHSEKMEKQTRFATARAINETLKLAQSRIHNEVKTKFNNPTPWASKPTYIVWANRKRERLSGEILAKDFGVRFEKSARAFIIPNAEGGERVDKLHERWLKHNRPGLLGPSKQLIQSRYAPANKYGNLSGGRYNAILSALGAQNDRINNSRNKKRRNYKRYFFGDIGSVRGIFERKGRSILPILIETNKQRYKPIIRWNEIILDTLNNEYESIFKRQLRRALKTAR